MSKFNISIMAIILAFVCALPQKVAMACPAIQLTTYPASVTEGGAFSYCVDNATMACMQPGYYFRFTFQIFCGTSADYSLWGTTQGNPNQQCGSFMTRSLRSQPLVPETCFKNDTVCENTSPATLKVFVEIFDANGQPTGISNDFPMELICFE